MLLAACGGGGGGASSGGGPIPATPVPSPSASPPSTSGTSTARVTITDPVGPSTLGAQRRPKHLPKSTKTIAISANGGAATSFAYGVNSPTCVISPSTVTCTFDVQVPTGNDAIVVQALNGTGKLLATATVQQAVSGTTVVPVTLAGVPSSVTVKLQQNTAPTGTATSVPLAVTAFDADGNAITGAYATPVTLTDDDKSGHTAISPNPVPSSTTAVGLTYDGGVANARISSALAGSGSDGFASGVAAHEYAVPSGTPATSNSGTGTIVLGGDGAMWFGEQNGVGRVDTSGHITEYPSAAQPQVMVRGPDGAVWFSSSFDRSTGNFGELCRVAADGSVTKLNVSMGPRFVVGADGNFWDVDGNGYVKRITPAGTVSTFSLVSPPGALNPGAHANDIVASPDGNLRVLDYSDEIIYTVSTSGSQLAATQMSPGQYIPSGGSAATFGPDAAIWYVSQFEVIRTTTGGATTEYQQFPGTLTVLNGIGTAAPLLSAADNNIWTTGAWFYGLQTMFRISPSSGAIVALPLPAVPATSVYGQPAAVGEANGPNGTIWYVRGSTVGWFPPPS